MDKKVAFILHGYGVNASYVRKIAYAYQEHVDDLLVIAPQAPELCSGENHGAEGFLPMPQQIVEGSLVSSVDLDPERRQWFGIETSDMSVMSARMVNVVKRINAFVDDICSEYNLSRSDAAMTGFSQGGSVALCAAYLGSAAYKCAISHSSIFFRFPEFPSTCPTLFIYGNNDEEFSVQTFELTAQNIKEHVDDLEVIEIDNLTHKTDERSREQMALYLCSPGRGASILRG